MRRKLAGSRSNGSVPAIATNAPPVLTNGVLYAPAGSTLTALYQDNLSPDDPDFSSDTAVVLLFGSGIVVRWFQSICRRAQQRQLERYNGNHNGRLDLHDDI